MKRLLFAAAVIAAFSCGPKPNEPRVSKDPISVRGWIEDVDTGAPAGNFRTVETEAARRAAMFQSMNVWVDNAPYVSGAISETGSFILLDVPPGNVKISFSAPGVPVANLEMKGIPGNADVLVPAIVLKSTGVAVIADPSKLRVRMAAQIAKPVATNQLVTVAGLQVPITNVPINDMIDRRDYPSAPTSKPVATVK